MDKIFDVLKRLVRAGDDGLFAMAMSAGFWAAALRVTVRLLLFIRTLILARLLAPDDFGLMGIAVISILFIESVTDSGVEAALVQKKEEIEEYLDTAWTMQIIRSLLTAGILVVFAPSIGSFFGSAEAESILRVLSITVALKGFANIGVVRFTKHLRFDKTFVLEMASRGLEFAISVGLAITLRSVWALVIGAMAGMVARVITSYLIDDYRPRVRWVWDQVKELFNFGKWILVTNLTVFGVSNIDDILVGRFLGVTQLGFYRMAYNLSQAVAAEIMVVTSQVAFPTFAKLQDARDRLRSAYVGSLHFVAFLGFPIAFGTILVAPDLVPAVLGETWLPIIEPLQWLSVAGLAKGLGGTTSPLFVSQGRPNIPPMFGAVRFVMMIASLPYAIEQWGITGAAVVVAVTSIITSGTGVVIGLRFATATSRDVRQSLIHPAINGLAMAVAVMIAQSAVDTAPQLASLTVAVVVGVAAYFGSVAVSGRLFGYQAPRDLVARVRGTVAP